MSNEQQNYLFTMDIQNYQKDARIFSRPSSRGIIYLNEDTLAMVYSTRKKFYKFPGGGVEKGESPSQGLIREVSEETGLCVDPSSIREYGKVLRRQCSAEEADTVFEQENTYYLCSVIHGAASEQHLDAYEAEDGFIPAAVTLAQAADVNRCCEGLDDSELVMIERDTRILELLAGREQIPSREMAKFLLREAGKKNPGPWTDHSTWTAVCAEQIAEKCGLDPDKAYVLGILHDIGRREGITGIAHAYDGWQYLKQLGYDSAARIALTHSFSLKRLDEYVGAMDLTEDQMQEMQHFLDTTEYDDYDRLIQLCDAMAMADKITTVEERMNDVKRRYGSYPQDKWDKNLELRDYFQKRQKTGTK